MDGQRLLPSVGEASCADKSCRDLILLERAARRAVKLPPSTVPASPSPWYRRISVSLKRRHPEVYDAALSALAAGTVVIILHEKKTVAVEVKRRHYIVHGRQNWNKRRPISSSPPMLTVGARRAELIIREDGSTRIQRLPWPPSNVGGCRRSNEAVLIRTCPRWPPSRRPMPCC